MREIKFRVWDTKNKQWLDTFNVILGTINLSDDVIYMQYTGLTDKNSKEIFEGDIIAISEIVLINWDFIVSSPLLIEFRNYGWFPFAHGLPSPSELEVIGNIYQHPELLKEKV